MALNLVDLNESFSGLTGVYAGQNGTPLFLGEKGRSKLIDAGTAGKIGIGFDTRISPAQVRIFYDKEGAIIQGTDPDKYYGLIMTREIRFDGLPVPPGVYATAIEFQNYYSSFVPRPDYDRRTTRPVSPAYAIDMMSPERLGVKGISDPYFADNALCYVDGMTLADTQELEAPNGFLAKLPLGAY